MPQYFVAAFLCRTAGTHVDMNPATLTLAALLGLHLHQHADTVARVCASALKELTIELELRKVAELWRSQRFKLHRYTSGGTEDRGWVLKGNGLKYLLCLSLLRSPRMERCAENLRLHGVTAMLTALSGGQVLTK